MKILPVLTAALLLCSCAADRETEALKNSLSEAQTAVRLSAENTKRLEDTYSDIYFHLDSLTVESFKNALPTETPFTPTSADRVAATATPSNPCSNATSPAAT